jgi:hypothetical protein
MSRKGRRGRSKNAATQAGTQRNGASIAPSVNSASEAPVLPSVEHFSGEPAAKTSTMAAGAKFVTAPPSGEPEPSLAFESDDTSVRNLHARFFDETSFYEHDDGLAHELDLGDPRLMQKMTDRVARRRAFLARYVAGVVGVAAALCVAALVKSAVPARDDDWNTRPAARMVMPPSEPLPAAQPAPEPAEPASRSDVLDGGRG